MAITMVMTEVCINRGYSSDLKASKKEKKNTNVPSRNLQVWFSVPDVGLGPPAPSEFLSSRGLQLVIPCILNTLVHARARSSPTSRSPIDL